jgi:predicted nucleic acid-binding protein
MDDSTAIIAAKSGLKRTVLELLEPWYMLDKSYDKSIRESANKGMADGILLERNVRTGNIIIMGLDDAHKRLAVKYSDLFKLKKGDNEILALCHQISAKGIVSEDDDFHSKKEEIQIALGNDFKIRGLLSVLLELLAIGKFNYDEFICYIGKISAFGYYKVELLDFVKDEGNKLRGVRKE